MVFVPQAGEAGHTNEMHVQEVLERRERKACRITLPTRKMSEFTAPIRVPVFSDM